MKSILESSAEWKVASIKLSEWTRKYLINRDDTYGSYNEGKPFRVKQPLTDKALQQHFAGFGQRVGLYSYGTDGYGRWLCVDIDAHGEYSEEVAQQNKERVSTIVARCQALGIVPLIEHTNGVGGYHVWIIFDSPVSLARLRSFGVQMSEDLGTPEVFPKQDEQKEFGGFVRLPGLHHKRKWFSEFLDLELSPVESNPIHLLRHTPNHVGLLPADVEQPTKRAKVIKPVGGRITGDLSTLDLVRLCEDNGLIENPSGDGFYSVVCPWQESHTSGDGLAYIHNGEDDRWPTFHCKHAHCSERKLMDYVRLIEPAIVDKYCSKSYVTGPDRLTEFKIAETIAKTHSDDMRYAKGTGWYFWADTHFSTQEEERAYHIVKDYLSSLRTRASNIEDEKERTATLRKLDSFETANKFHSLLECCSKELTDNISVFDTDPYLFNCLNGTIDLRTGKLRPHSRGDRITKLSNVVYDESAKCERWGKFIDEVCLSRADLKRFLQQAVGASLSGVSIKKLFFLHGEGDNGKTTFLNPISAILGNYGGTIPIESLCVKKGDSIPNDLARLPGVRFVSTSETEAGKHLNESLIKLVTGGGTISARFMRQEWFDYAPVFKLWMDGNHKPVIKGTDKAIWNRLVLIPFEACFTGRIDYNLPTVLRSELSGILRWAVEGCLDWQANGFQEPEICQAAKEAYREEQDTFGNFIAEQVTRKEGSSVKLNDMFLAYCNWATFAKIQYPLNKFVFGRKFGESGFDQDAGRRKWLNVEVINFPM